MYMYAKYLKLIAEASGELATGVAEDLSLEAVLQHADELSP